VSRGKEVPFDEYLDLVFAGPMWVDACTSMLSVFLEDVEGCREDPGEGLPEIAPSILDQVARVGERARRLESRFRQWAQGRGPTFQTTELGALLWWAGLASHKGAGGVETVRRQIERQAWEDVFIDLHTLMFDTMSALSLLGVAERVIHRLDADGEGGGRPN
jgi:hypothetical protein